jgi:hypothetical protein
MDAQSGAEVGAIAAAVAAVVLRISFFITWWSTAVALKETSHARFLEAINQIYADLHSEESKVTRRYVYNSKPSELVNSPPEGIVQIEKVADSFEHIGLLAQHSLVAKEIILDYFWEAILQMWVRLEPYVKATRERRGRQYADHFEMLALDAEAYRKRKHPHYRVGGA